jgi:NAD(P)-dependent dehydrogenase (short-subunit alcohol dehydrogenase family)
LELRNKVAVITGGSKGIELGIAHAFAGEGANLVMTAARRAKSKRWPSISRIGTASGYRQSPRMSRPPKVGSASRTGTARGDHGR